MESLQWLRVTFLALANQLSYIDRGWLSNACQITMHNRIGPKLTADHSECGVRVPVFGRRQFWTSVASLCRVFFPTTVRTNELNKISNVNAHQFNDVRGTYLIPLSPLLSLSLSVTVNVNVKANGRQCQCQFFNATQAITLRRSGST